MLELCLQHFHHFLHDRIGNEQTHFSVSAISRSCCGLATWYAATREWPDVKERETVTDLIAAGAERKADSPRSVQ